MPRSNKQSLDQKIKNIPKDYPDDFVTKFDKLLKCYRLYCSHCRKFIKIDHQHLASQVKSHLDSAFHDRNKKLTNNRRQSTIDESLESAVEVVKASDQFNLRLAEAWMSAGIPFYTLKNPLMKSFLQAEFKHLLPDTSTLRKFAVPKLYENKMQEIREFVGQNYIYLIIDETTDSCNRYVLNILVGILDGISYKTMVLHTAFLDSTKNAFISQEIIKSLNILWKFETQVRFERLWLVVTDQGTNMMASIRYMKNFCVNLHHVTCIVHALNRVCDLIKQNYDHVDKFNACLKSIFSKSPNRIKLWQELFNLPLPPKPVVSRWNTWLLSAFHTLDYFDNIEVFLSNLDKEESIAVDCAKSYMDESVSVNSRMKEELKEQLLDLHQFRFLTETIVKLQTSTNSMRDQFNLFNEARNQLSGQYREK